MTLVCFQIGICVPFTSAWQDALSEGAYAGFRTFDRMINYCFIFDIFLNFRTGYYDHDNTLVMDWRRVSVHYVKGWFWLDLASSLPTSEIPECVNCQHVTSLKILRLSKLLKMLRLLRPRNVDVSELSATLDDFIQGKFVQLLMRKSKVFVYMLIVCHWMACGMKLADSGGDYGWLVSYRDVGGNLGLEYTTAIYWAMTTLTTVGYGDIVPLTTVERAYTTCAMVVGGGFYGYVVGAITSVVSNSDLNSSAYYERMDKIHAWLNHHKIP